jgi:AraC family transcriptional regulator
MGSIERLDEDLVGRHLSDPPPGVQVTDTKTDSLIGQARAFTASGLTLRHVQIDGGSGYSFRYTGDCHYLALHDLHYKDGETFLDGLSAEAPRNIRGRLTFMPPKCSAWGWSIPAPGPQSFTALYVEPGAMEPDVAASLRRLPEQARLYFSDSALHSTFDKLRSSLLADCPQDKLYLESLCLVAVLELCQPQKIAREFALSKVATHRIAEFVDQNLSDDIGLTELADIAGLTRFHFLRAFKQATCETPYQYILRCRIERAMELLRDPRMSISAIALAVGFRKSTRFAAAFRRITGNTPSSFRAAALR